MIPVFECPLLARCYKDKMVVWRDNEPHEIIIPRKCRAPFLINRKTGQYICRIVIEDDKKENWDEAIEGIGRARRRVGKCNELKGKRKKGRA